MNDFKLPVEVYSPDQLGQLLWELDALSARLHDSQTRHKLDAKAHDPKQRMATSRLLQKIVEARPVISSADVEVLAAQLATIRDTAPQMHMLLSASPSEYIKTEIIGWLRREIHPHTLCSFAARADLGGGIILRTSANQYDFSFKTKLLSHKHRIQELVTHA